VTPVIIVSTYTQSQTTQQTHQ